MRLHIEDLSGNAPAEVAVAAGITSGVLLLTGAVITFARRKLHKAGETAGEVDDFFLELFRRTNLALVFFPRCGSGRVHWSFRKS